MKVCIALFFLFYTLSAFAGQADPVCVKWLKGNKIEPGTPNCKSDCLSAKVDMGTFSCNMQCDLLCKKDDLTSSYIYYPGLTPDEKALVSKYPKEAIIVFIQKEKAELSSSRNFPTQGLSDESDAFRHFIWSGLLTKELGEEKAKAFLDAHENNILQTTEQKSMDTTNNLIGVSSAKKLIEANNFSLKNLEKSALDALTEKQLIIINPGLYIPKEPQ